MLSRGGRGRKEVRCGECGQGDDEAEGTREWLLVRSVGGLGKGRMTGAAGFYELELKSQCVSPKEEHTPSAANSQLDLGILEARGRLAEVEGFGKCGEPQRLEPTSILWLHRGDWVQEINREKASLNNLRGGKL